jgi:hypothetical protein
LAAEPAAASATTFSANITSAGATDVPDLSRKTAMVAVPTDTADATTADIAAAEWTTEEAPSTEKHTPNTDRDKDETTAKDDDSVAADKPDHPSAPSPKPDADNGDASPKHETKKADNENADKESQPEGAKQK